MINNWRNETQEKRLKKRGLVTRRDMNIRARGRDLNTINSEEGLGNDGEQMFFPGSNSRGRVYSKVFGLGKDILI